jgi:hypothetical protein
MTLDFAVMTTDTSKDNSASWAWRDNIGLLAGTGSVAFIAVRLLSVAGGDPETAYTILQSQGTATIVVGSLISLVGLVAVPVAIAFMRYAYVHQPTDSNDRTSSYSLALSSGLALIAIYTAPAGELVASVVVALVFGYWTSRLFHRKTELDNSKRFSFKVISPHLLIIYFITIMIINVASVNPWLPSESISIKGGAPFSGFILSEGGTNALILTADPIGIVQLPRQDITGTAQCEMPEYAYKYATFGELLARVTHYFPDLRYPACPSGLSPAWGLTLAKTGTQRSGPRS